MLRNCNIHEISSDFFSQSCLYLTYSRTVKGTGNSTHVQISLIDPPDETRKGIRDLAAKVETTGNVENSRPLLLKAYKSGNACNHSPHQVLLFLLLTGAVAYAEIFLLLFLATCQVAPVNHVPPVYCSKWILSCQARGADCRGGPGTDKAAAESPTNCPVVQTQHQWDFLTAVQMAPASTAGRPACKEGTATCSRKRAEPINSDLQR